MNRYLTGVLGPGILNGTQKAIISLSIFFLCVASTCATTVRAPDFETLVDRADLIFTGRAVSQRSEWINANGRKAIVTLVSFAVEKMHKGQGVPVITLEFLGGRMGEVTLDVAEMPRFKMGDRAVLFIEHNGTAASPVVGFFHGRFPVKKDASGHDTVLKHNGELFYDVAELGPRKHTPVASTPVRTMSHEEFSNRIRERLALSRGK